MNALPPVQSQPRFTPRRLFVIGVVVAIAAWVGWTAPGRTESSVRCRPKNKHRYVADTVTRCDPLWCGIDRITADRARRHAAHLGKQPRRFRVGDLDRQHRRRCAQRGAGSLPRCGTEELGERREPLATRSALDHLRRQGNLPDETSAGGVGSERRGDGTRASTHPYDTPTAPRPERRPRSATPTGRPPCTTVRRPSHPQVSRSTRPAPAGANSGAAASKSSIPTSSSTSTVRLRLVFRFGSGDSFACKAGGPHCLPPATYTDGLSTPRYPKIC